MMHIIPPINRIVKFFLSALTMILLCMPIQAQIDEWLQRLEKHNPNYPVYCDSDTITIKEYNQRIREMAKAHEEEGMSGAEFFGILFGVALTISFIIGSIVIVMARREQRRKVEKERKRMHLCALNTTIVCMLFQTASQPHVEHTTLVATFVGTMLGTTPFKFTSVVRTAKTSIIA